jgi:pilus assembly protein CpaF
MSVDHALVTRLRGRVVEELRQEQRHRRNVGQARLSRDDERQLGRSLIGRALQEHRADQLREGIPLPGEEEDTNVADAVHAALFGLGRLQPLIDDQNLSEINIRGYDDVWLIRDDGSKVRGAAVADSDGELVEWVRTMATYTGLSSRPWDLSNRKLEFRMPDGSRLVGLMGAVERPVISIRLNRRPRVNLTELRLLGSFDEQLEAFLTAVILARMNVMISGETGSGKTTLLRAATSAIPPWERLVTVEHFLELGLQDQPDLHPDVIATEEQLANSEGEGGLSVAELVQISRRLDPDRLLVGESIGGDVVAFLDAMTQGNDGGLTTIHARSGRSVPQRIAIYAVREGMSVEAALMLVAGAVDFVVHMTRERTGDGRLHRYVSSVVEVVGYDGGQVITSEVFRTEPGGLLARPAAAVTDARAVVLRKHGYDWGVG